MGTGEATGEKRALRAAEAAIANPLLDDVCMKGARGLLISITGGSDLTLYEVDEAATRIREEVDQDANVIFGATRDDSLEGIVRVSVVATGIDQELGRDAAPAMEPRIAEVDRAPAQRGAPAPADAGPGTATPPRPASRPRSRRRRLRPSRPTSSRRSSPQSTSRRPWTRAARGSPRRQHPPGAAQAGLRRARCWSARPSPSRCMPQPQLHPAAGRGGGSRRRACRASTNCRSPASAFRAERTRPAGRRARPAREEAGDADGAPRGQAGFGRKHEDDRRRPRSRAGAAGLCPAGSRPAAGLRSAGSSEQQPCRQPLRRPRRCIRNTPSASRRPGAPPARAGQLDQHGRQPAPQRPYEDDHLEIPAFLRRQSTDDAIPVPRQAPARPGRENHEARLPASRASSF